MSRVRGKVKIQWIVDKSKREAAFRKRRATLLEKAQELSILCDVPVAAVVYGPGELDPTVWPSVPEATAILQRHANVPDSLKEKSTLDYEGFLRQRIQKLSKKAENDRIATRDDEINIILNDIGLGRRRNMDNLSPEVAANVKWVLQMRMKTVGDCINFLRSEGAPAALSPPRLEAALVTASQEPPLSMAPMVADAPLLLPMPPQSALVGAPQEPPMVPPLAMALMVAVAPPVLPAVEPHPAAAVVGVNAPMDLDGEPQHGSYLLEMIDAIMDDGVQATGEDVDRILKEHGLFNLKPM
ncbi:agamous-like MADS-box protein AGL80 [Phragmites australis]|uniref:agamous-like MADS-box protein AGL80 n=1 Tax=Phragmites australis TaxID=29695 RepID=UPI002D791C1C|nr:agamous-like MADS-box protein AGL80 [Phragmites australis]